LHLPIEICIPQAMSTISCPRSFEIFRTPLTLITVTYHCYPHLKPTSSDPDPPRQPTILNMADTDNQMGVYKPAPPGALRTPCPVLNALANHGYIPRDGRDMTSAQLSAAFRYLGFGPDTTSFLVGGAFKVHADDPPAGSSTSRLGLRDADEINSNGTPVLNLNQIGRPHAVEHDVSITRQDRELGNCIILQPQLLQAFLACPANGHAFTSSDIGRFRRERYDQQKRDNAQLDFDPAKHQLACGEIGAFQGIFGKGLSYSIPIAYVKAMFEDERLPFEEGWTPRRTPLLFPELWLLLKLISNRAWPFSTSTKQP